MDGTRERLGLLWKGHELLASDRSPQAILQDRGPGRAPRDQGEADGQAAHARPRSGADAAGAAGLARRAGGRYSLERTRSGAAPPSHTRRGPAIAATRSARATSAPDLRGPTLDRRRDPGLARQRRREPARSAPAAPRQLPPRVQPRLGQQDLLPPAQN